MMFTACQFRRVAFATLASFAFAQAAVAAMGCATLRADAARGNVAVMPSGEPCDMMGDTPAPLTLKHCAQATDTATGDIASLDALDFPAAVTLWPAAGFITLTPLDGTHHAARILGPPPFALTQRLRI